MSVTALPMLPYALAVESRNLSTEFHTAEERLGDFTEQGHPGGQAELSITSHIMLSVFCTAADRHGHPILSIAVYGVSCIIFTFH